MENFAQKKSATVFARLLKSCSSHGIVTLVGTNKNGNCHVNE